MIEPAAVPFYSNSPDDTHCLQAGIKMVLGYFMPAREFSWHELEQMSAKGEGLATWPQKMLISLDESGFDVQMVEGFDGQAFIKQGERYLQETFGNEVAAWQIKNSDIPNEQLLYQEAFERGINIETRIPNISDLQDYMKRDYIVTANVNSRALHQQNGYAGHFVVILSIDDADIVLHDPGLPPTASLRVSRDSFEAAWGNPNEQAKNFIAIKLKERI